ncbi:pyruvate kinase [Mucilaginibacter gotjawali]|uniref:Pyruvate kinase n=2 Tax=Mucilaginibacter gotjawali TaxID=1550579 RepID=A0A839SFM1_9SPHI|nr:pyruvate kinase [Mucilaginibacter gotjawali]MBB3056093.1 pyruvate kinase [Mucilaginibacter gotjawali]BAU53570.1 Pyruvate kinase [Mucilaginibacter gotjawali]
MKTDSLQKVRTHLRELEKNMLLESEKRVLKLKDIDPQQQHSLRNLIHYLTLRSEDIRELQDALHIHGLSSLASSESHIHRQLQSILQWLKQDYPPDELDECNYEFGTRQIEERSKILFGEKNENSTPFIMVTFDISFTEDYALIKALLQNGMNVARINCAHDDEATWSAMIHQLEKACHETGLNCKIYMDIAGPKIRTLLINKGHKKGKVKIKENELIWLADHPKHFAKDDIVINPNIPGIVSMIKKGERVFIDDGMIEGVVEAIEKRGAAVRIVRISSGKSQIKSHKGINFPDSEISVSPITDFDKACLPFICKYADLVGYSFIRNATDLENLQSALNELAAKPPYIIMKIETPESVKNLPALLIEGMRQKAFGVMIARGDLAVEIGFERTGEIQDEILWICEAAHVPVVWATQVLETLNKTGIATRSEITDAAHAVMAECVMINKGEHTIKVIETLRNVLHRIGGHHIKKRFTFRPLGIAQKFINEK